MINNGFHKVTLDIVLWLLLSILVTYIGGMIVGIMVSIIVGISIVMLDYGVRDEDRRFK